MWETDGQQKGFSFVLMSLKPEQVIWKQSPTTHSFIPLFSPNPINPSLVMQVHVSKSTACGLGSLDITPGPFSPWPCHLSQAYHWAKPVFYPVTLNKYIKATRKISYMGSFRRYSINKSIAKFGKEYFKKCDTWKYMKWWNEQWLLIEYGGVPRCEAWWEKWIRLLASLTLDFWFNSVWVILLASVSPCSPKTSQAAMLVGLGN